MKHFHMLMALITLMVFFWQVWLVCRDNKQVLPKSAKIASHIGYALLILTGLLTAMPLIKAGMIPHWLIAKIVLLVVAMSATFKALRATTAVNQAKIGMLIAGVAYTGVLILAFVKPMNLF